MLYASIIYLGIWIGILLWNLNNWIVLFLFHVDAHALVGILLILNCIGKIDIFDIIEVIWRSSGNICDVTWCRCGISSLWHSIQQPLLRGNYLQPTSQSDKVAVSSIHHLLNCFFVLLIHINSFNSQILYDSWLTDG